MSRDEDDLVNSWKRFRPTTALAGHRKRETLDYFDAVSSRVHDAGDYIPLRLEDLKRDSAHQVARVAKFLDLDELDPSCIGFGMTIDDDARQRLSANGMVRGK
jgi:hypothetical protein